MASISTDQDLPPPLHLELGDRSYEIHIGPGLLARAGRLIEKAVAPSQGFIVTHPRVAALHGTSLREGLGFPSSTILVPAGERQKTLRRAAVLYDQLLTLAADRQSAIIAFGGGVIGDLAGFVAATYMRGLAYVQVPTTLLAQVDASVGGKVAVDHPRAKNLIGAFHQPRVVIADSETLRTLRERDYRAGLAEVVKHAVLADAAFFGWLEDNLEALSRRDPGAIAYAVRRSCEIKAEVVGQDEREAGLRAVLNLGHTVGHALEALAGYRGLRHGEAVAIGLTAAAALSRRLGRLAGSDAERIERLLRGFALPVHIAGIPAERILGAMKADKKALRGVPRFVLPVAIGAVEVLSEVPEQALRAALTGVGAEAG